MLVFENRGNRSTRRKPLGAEQRTNKLSPHMTPDLEIEPGPHWWEASALATAPSLHPKQGVFGTKVRYFLMYDKLVSDASAVPRRGNTKFAIKQVTKGQISIVMRERSSRFRRRTNALNVIFTI